MGLQCGIVGLPNVGKSTLFNALTNAGAAASNFPFCTIDPNIGVVGVPDPRLSVLSGIVKPEKTTPTSLEIVDIAGLVKGASEGKGRGNAFLSHIREVDLILHVVRCFEDENVIHVEDGVDAIRDIRTIEDELVLKDLETVEKREEKLANQAKSRDKDIVRDFETVRSLREFIETGRRARDFPRPEGNEDALRELFLLSEKPVIYVCNVSEDEVSEAGENAQVRKVMEHAARSGDDVIVVSARIEAEIAELEGEERAAFLEELGLSDSGLDRLVNCAYSNLGLLTYFTSGPKEVRAWTVRRGTRAPQAAGIIHTDFERGFIRAETISYEDYVREGSEQMVREAGKMRLEGKDYEVCDGDVMFFRFNV